MEPDRNDRCWLCGASDLQVAKPADLQTALAPQSFAITDNHYGQTGEIHRCGACGFLQCSRLDDVLPYYVGLEDPEYEEGRAERSLQMRKILDRLPGPAAGRTLLDVGAGSGMLVEQALLKGYAAEGIEPSQWLADQAQKRGLPVELGTLPHAALRDHYDVITLVDVIEHVSNPVELLAEIRDRLTERGTLLIVTPDVDSFVARWLSWKWWHFRVAHIGYFNRSTLALALSKAGLALRSVRRPTWYFSADYLVERVNRYLPSWFQLPIPRFLNSLIIPLNLGDSILAIAVRQDRS